MREAQKNTRQRYDAQLKAQVVSECAQPGASVARVALAHGINANLVHRWRRLAEPCPAPLAQFVPLALPAPSAAAPSDIRIELRRGATAMTINWPVAASADCASWMRELLR